MPSLEPLTISILPDDLLSLVISFLSNFADVLSASAVSKAFRAVVKRTPLNLVFDKRSCRHSSNSACVEDAIRLVRLASLSVVSLDLSRCNLSSSTLQYVMSCPSLEELLLGDASRSENVDGFPNLALPRLRTLGLVNTKLLPELSSATSVKTLALINCILSVETINTLASFREIQWLSLGGSRPAWQSDLSCWTYLQTLCQGLPNLKYLETTFLPDWVGAEIQSKCPSLVLVDMLRIHLPGNEDARGYLEVHGVSVLPFILTACNAQRETALHLACEQGNAASVRWLVHRGANTRLKVHKGFTPLFIAAEHGCAECCDILIQADAACVDIKNHNFETPLYIASLKGHLAALRVLLAHNARTDLLDFNGWNCLHAACVNLHHVIEVVRTLLDAGVPPHIPNRFGMTALHICTRGGFHAGACLLLERAGSGLLHARDHDGKTAADLCTDPVLLATLLAHGAPLTGTGRHRRQRRRFSVRG